MLKEARSGQQDKTLDHLGIKKVQEDISKLVGQTGVWSSSRFDKAMFSQALVKMNLKGRRPDHDSTKGAEPQKHTNRGSGDNEPEDKLLLYFLNLQQGFKKTLGEEPTTQASIFLSEVNTRMDNVWIKVFDKLNSNNQPPSGCDSGVAQDPAQQQSPSGRKKRRRTTKIQPVTEVQECQESEDSDSSQIYKRSSA